MAEISMILGWGRLVSDIGLVSAGGGWGEKGESGEGFLLDAASPSCHEGFQPIENGRSVLGK